MSFLETVLTGKELDLSRFTEQLGLRAAFLLADAGRTCSSDSDQSTVIPEVLLLPVSLNFSLMCQTSQRQKKKCTFCLYHIKMLSIQTAAVAPPLKLQRTPIGPADQSKIQFQT